MTKTFLQQKLKAKIQETGISVHALEKKAGLKPSAVQNILQGRSKKPNAEILHAVAKVLGCNIYELIGSEPSTIVSQVTTGMMEVIYDDYKSELFLEAVRMANKIFKTKGIKPTNQIAFSYICDIYGYSIETKATTIDVRYAEWLARKRFSNNNNTDDSI